MRGKKFPLPNFYLAFKDSDCIQLQHQFNEAFYYERISVVNNKK